MKHEQTLGVVIGRFQVPELHGGHLHLLTHAKRKNNSLLIVVGSGRGLATARNPLPFPTRKAMLVKSFPEATVIEQLDHPDDREWSRILDERISALFPSHAVTLYGSRDSFIPRYSGRMKTEVVEAIPAQSGSELRTQVRECMPHTGDFRRGIIYAQEARLPIAYPAVDIAIVREDRGEVLLGRKAIDGNSWRFIGGFVDPLLDRTLEEAAKREAYEETGGMEIGTPTYIGSLLVDDWRYRGSNDRIMTSFFRAPYIFGGLTPRDDIDELAWVPLTLIREKLIPSHQPLGEMLIAKSE